MCSHASDTQVGPAPSMVEVIAADGGHTAI
jgi:hypothetical protein